MKIQDRENRKILTGFRDMMADFFTENRDLIPPPGGPLILCFDRKNFVGSITSKRP